MRQNVDVSKDSMRTNLSYFIMENIMKNNAPLITNHGSILFIADRETKNGKKALFTGVREHKDLGPGKKF